MYIQVHQEQIAAEQDFFERVQQHTVQQIVHVPIPHIQEQIVEGVKQIPQERFPEKTVEQIVDIPVPPIFGRDSAEVMSSSHAAVHAAEQIVAREVTQNTVCAPVCVGDTGFNTGWACQCEVLRVGDRQYEGQLRVLHAVENPDDFRSGHWIPVHCFRPDGKRTCVRRCWW